MFDFVSIVRLFIVNPENIIMNAFLYVLFVSKFWTLIYLWLGTNKSKFTDSNQFIANVVEKHWSEQYWKYSYESDATRWMMTGDTRTGLPFLLNRVDRSKMVRVWVPMPHDGEVVALDIAFPFDGHDAIKPIYLIFHGLNGGSDEGRTTVVHYQSFVDIFVVKRSCCRL
jgi:hypothetical protein